ncbi:MAG: hypothetical protein OMM_04057 [Candidatus Magnetoglobus multicellularis str. Araruama]|uniref:Lcl C-terminal domain-containing protein n=1 Tax=Candidatus Magnetoglobus multicellularis str. Araruama TaxID=890399 RepID=A0A1V1P369_9BACT|nr:MAG: hypothetical protein OMM_04057 [Candidatus Magnetoglobus multicellularis str. Araruama]
MRGVRGNIYYDSNRFHDNNDGTITDTVTGLMWQQATSIDKSWQDALNTCHKLQLAGYSDWRLPGREVLRSIVDYTQYAAALNKNVFPQSASIAYWTSTTDQQHWNHAWCIHFQIGNDLSRSKDLLYAVRAVRGGQQTSAGHIKILEPSTGDRLNTGTQTMIQWDTHNISGLVDIQLSQFGGSDGSFETIIADTPNDGQEQWIVIGQTSENCVLQVVPKSLPHASGSVGMFSIDHFSGAWINGIPVGNYHTYRLMLLGHYSDHTELIEANWQMDPLPGVTLSENNISTTQNSWAKVFTDFERVTYERWFALYYDVDQTENEANNEINQARLMTDRTFYTGFIGDNDIDIYKIGVFDNEIIELAFLPQTDYADYFIHIQNDMNTRIYEKFSTNGSSFHTQLGLTEGNYYVHIQPNGDIASKSPYAITYALTGHFQTNAMTSIQLGETISGRNASLVDIATYSFSITQTTGIVFDFYPSNQPIEYDIQIQNASHEIMEQANCLDQQNVHMEILLNQGSYKISVIPKSQVDRSVQYRFLIDKSDLPIENDANQTFDSAMIFDDQQPIRGSLKNSADIDYFSFYQELPEIRLLTLADAADGSDTWIRIFKDSEQHATHQYYVKDGIFFSKNIGLSNGRYYIALASQSETVIHQYYTLSFKSPTSHAVEIEPNNSLSWCNAIKENRLIRGMVYPEADSDWYGFQLASPGMVYLTFEPANQQSTYEISLLDAYENIIQYRTVSQAKVYTGAWMLDPGKTYIHVKCDSADTGDYQFYVNSDQPLTGLTRIQTISINNVPSRLNKGAIHPLSVQAHLSNAETIGITNPNWYVLDKNIITIDDNGWLSALDTGETTVIAEYQGNVAQCQIGVEQMPAIKHGYGQLMLVAGSHESESASRFQTTQYLADLIYKRFLDRGFHHDDIFYFNATQWHDLDDDGYDDNIVDISTPDTPSFINTFNQIKSGINQAGPLYIYLIGPSGNNAFEIAPDEYINAILLNDLLYEYALNHNRKIVCVIESPKAWQFTDALTIQDSHVLITPSKATDAHTLLNGRVSFTQLFVDGLCDGKSIDTAFNDAATDLFALRTPFANMVPSMTQSSPGIADTTYLVGPFLQTRSPIQITADNPVRTFTASTVQEIKVAAIPTYEIVSIDAVISSPDYLIPKPVEDFQFPDTHRTSFSLTSVPKTNTWKATYNRFDYSGMYWIDLCVIDTANHLSLSQSFGFTVINGKATDMDLDGMPDAWEDRFVGLDKTVPDASEDIDKDGLSNLDEYLWQCNPIIGDTDMDYLYDGWEVDNGMNPIDPSDAWLDPDNDNVTNYQEYLDHTDPQDEQSFVQHYGDIRGEIYTKLVGYEAGIKNAKITIVEIQTETVSTQDGLFVVTNLPYGRYTVRIEADNFKMHTAKVFLSKRSVFIGKIRLLFEAEYPDCDLNENHVLDLSDIIRALQVLIQ